MLMLRALMTTADGKKGFGAYILWIAWRNVTAKNRRAGLSFMTLVSIFGVAIGVAALIIVLSVMGGFEGDLKEKMLRGQPHLEILHKNAVAGFSLTEKPLATFKKLFPEATDVEAYTQADVVLRQQKHITSAVIFGVDADREGHLWGFGNAMTEGEMNAIGRTHPIDAEGKQEKDVSRRPGIVLGEQLAEQLSAEVGDEITVLSPQAASVGAALGGATTSRRYVVAGKFRTGLFNYDAKWAVVSLEEGRKFMPDYDESLDEGEYVTGVAVNVKEPYDVEGTAQRIFGDYEKDLKITVTQDGAVEAEKGSDAAPSKLSTAPPGDRPGGSIDPFLKDLVPLTWQKANKSLLFALKLEKFAMGSILMLIVVVAGFSISGTMMMTVFHKRGQVSLLRSLGMNRNEIAKLYLTHGFTIGTIGILAGLGLGLAVCALIRSFQFIHLPAGIYHLKNLPCKWLPVEYSVICVAAWLFSLAAATYPALTAARQDPGQGLRYL
jgi:lipoprotein-releasing system permease protein